MKLRTFFPISNDNSYLDYLAGGLDDKNDATLFLVNTEYTADNLEARLSGSLGLDFALTLETNGGPLILCSFLPKSYFLKKERFSRKFLAILAKPHTAFMRLPFDSEDLKEKCSQLLMGKKVEDTLAIELSYIQKYNSVMATIRHGIYSLFGDSSDWAKQKIRDGIEEARIKLLLSGSDEEIASEIKDFKPKGGPSTFAGRFFPGVFCDIQGTLMVNDQISDKVLSQLKQFSLTKPITLWTGAVSRFDSIREELVKAGIEWKLVSKSDFANAEVEIAIDDQDFNTFHDQYKVKVRKFIKV